MTQTNQMDGFPGGGRSYCAPVSVSNSLVWLEKAPGRNYQISVAMKLGSPDYMNTNVKSGTSVLELIKGVDRYARETWGSYHRLEYCGWRPAPQERTVSNQPTLSWMTDALHDRAACWVNVGWYNANTETGNFDRVGGHWITLIGYSKGNWFFATRRHVPARVRQTST